MAEKLRVGDVAPDFELKGTGGQTYRLSDYKGRRVVLAFYPGDNTTVCTRQLKSYTVDFSRFRELDSEVLGISPQNVESHEQFAARHDFPFPLLFDESKRVGEMYGIVGTVGFYRRSIFVVDATGVISYIHRAMLGVSYVSVDEIVEALEATN